MTTMTMGRARMNVEWCPRWATVVHGGVLAAVIAGVLATWVTAALVAALLVTPVQAMTTFGTRGVWGLSDVVRQGTAVILGSPSSSSTSREAR